MHHRLIIVDELGDWRPYLPTEGLISAASYLSDASAFAGRRTRVINLCRDLHYGGSGYHCSLLAEARGHQVIPPVRAIGDLEHQAFYRLFGPRARRSLERWVQQQPERTDEFRARAYFGHCDVPGLEELARQLFEQYRFPILEFSLLPGPPAVLGELCSVPLTALAEAEQDAFADALEAYDKHLWRSPRTPRPARYDIAILHDPEEKLPPSNRAALQRFRSAGRELGMQVDLITEQEFGRLLEYDALFIRSTTAVNHHTYRFARRARDEGLVVIDSPEAILSACNKVYLAELLARHGIPTPETRALVKDAALDADELGASLGWPVVIKVPDGSYSRGVVKAGDADELLRHCARLFEDSAVLLAQSFVPTNFDWRIGVLDGRALYACRYHMVDGHWQIYQHGAKRTRSGGFDCLPLNEVPRHVVRWAERAARLLGRGLFGVDLKERDGQALVIEVNDNPSIDAGVEDSVLGHMLYRSIMSNLLDRIEQRHEQGRIAAV